MLVLINLTLIGKPGQMSVAMGSARLPECLSFPPLPGFPQKSQEAYFSLLTSSSVSAWDQETQTWGAGVGPEPPLVAETHTYGASVGLALPLPGGLGGFSKPLTLLSALGM